MSKETTIYYGDKLIASFNAGQTATLTTGGDKLKHDLVVKAGGDVPESEWIGDGNTHIWISLAEGRTSPMLGVGVDGTATVDWGDGTTPDVLTGTSVHSVRWTPVHEYAKAGDYVITIDGKIGFGGSNSDNHGAYIFRSSDAADPRNYAYLAAVRKVEMGTTCTFSNSGNAFNKCYSLESVYIRDGVNSLYDRTFASCYHLESVNIPESVNAIGTYTFEKCYSLKNAGLQSRATTTGSGTFMYCYTLANVNIPENFTSISNSMFGNNYALASVRVPSSVTSVGQNAFISCVGLKYVDFTSHTKIPTLGNSTAFSSGSGDLEIRVPAALADAWKAATNWSYYAEKIVGV